MGDPGIPQVQKGTAARFGTDQAVPPPDRDPGRILDRFRLVQPFLRRLDPEFAHGLTLWALRLGLAPHRSGPEDPILATRVWGRDFPNPLGLAAGFDKDATAIRPLLGLGFGFVEVGSITPEAQPGNPKPRIFRLVEDQAIINRLGFNSAGMTAAAARLARSRAAGVTGLVGVNLGKNRDSRDAAAGYAAGARLLGPFADYLAINVSSPNTPGLRALQGRRALAEIIARVRAALAEVRPEAPPPLLVKIAPDLSSAEVADIAAVALESDLAGLIVGNTTLERPPGLAGRHRCQTGGLSGRPLFAPSTRVLAEISRLTGGRLALIGVGGVASGAEAYAKIRAGACLIQLYSGLVYQGPGLISRIKADLAACLRRDGWSSLAEAVGADRS